MDKRGINNESFVVQITLSGSKENNLEYKTLLMD
jgi:hypothetical protein